MEFVYDVWYYVFEKCSAFQLLILRSTCKTFWEWLEIGRLRTTYRFLVDKEYDLYRQRIYSRGKDKYLKARSTCIRKQLLLMSSYTDDYIVVDENYCPSKLELQKNKEKHLCLNGFLVSGLKSSSEVKIYFGGHPHGCIDMSILSSDLSCFSKDIKELKKDGFLFYPLFQSGALIHAPYHIVTFQKEVGSDVKILLLCQYRKNDNVCFTQKDFHSSGQCLFLDSNLTHDGRIAYSNDAGMFNFYMIH